MSGADFVSPEHEKLDAITGVWRTQITMLDPAGNEIERHAATDTYRWMPGRHFLLHDVDATMPGGPYASLEIIAVDPATGRYASRNYDNTGAITESTMMFDGRTWSIDSENERFRGALADDGRTLTGRWERREGGNWLAWMDVTLTRQAGTP